MSGIPCELRVVEKVSKAGNTYNALQVTIKGKTVDIGIVNVYIENALLRCGIDIQAERNEK